LIVQLQHKIVEQDPVKNPLLRTKSVSARALSGTDTRPEPALGGRLIINADDWGRDAQTTDRTLDCFQQGVLSSASGMVFMQDSARAASIAAEQGLDIGLHLNFTAPFSAPGVPSRLAIHHQKVREYLHSHRFAQVLYNPKLANSFEYAVARQFEEFGRLYGRTPGRIDGHHHMHLCANVLFANLLPAGIIVRRNFSFAPGEKSWINRTYRKWVDMWLKRRHCLVDFFFSLAPVQAVGRLQRILFLGRHAVVELETHPVNPDEFWFLTSGEIFEQLSDLRIAAGFVTSGADENGFLRQDSLEGR
jgi:chitin disaccharide deacetylase